MEAISFTVVVPVFNEALLLERNLVRLYAHLATMPVSWEIVLVDDGSADATPAVANAFAQTHAMVRVLRHERNRGLAAAMKTGSETARGDCVLMLDADLSYEPSTVTRLFEAWKAAKNGEPSRSTVVLASPYMSGGGTRNVPAERLFLSVWANRLLSLAGGGRIKTFTGMVRAYDRALLASIQWPVSGNVNVALLASALRRGSRVVEIPAELAWPAARGASRLSFRRAFAEIASVLRFCFTFVLMRKSR